MSVPAQGLSQEFEQVNYTVIAVVESFSAEPPITMDMMHEANARRMEEHAHCTKEETIALLRYNGAMAAEVVRGVADEHLGRRRTGASSCAPESVGGRQG